MMIKTSLSLPPGNSARLTICLAALLTAVLSITPAHSADAPGASDHPLMRRVTGAEIFFHASRDFDRLKLALGPLEWNGAEAKVRPYESVTVEGKCLTNYYVVPENIGVLEALRNHEQDLHEKGFEILFSGIGEEVETPGYNNQIAHEILGMKGIYGTPEERAQWPFQHTEERQAGYLAARLTQDSGAQILASLYVVSNTHANWDTSQRLLPGGSTLVRLDVCETTPRQQRMELVQSETMAGEIALNGRIALYGIQFDYNSTSLKSESQATLTEILRLLQEKPSLSILVVGHTDSDGSFDYNRRLSEQRAQAVVAHLSQAGISSRRLFPVGVSFASPVATNRTEEGRTQNRRVELVDMASGKVD